MKKIKLYMLNPGDRFEDLTSGRKYIIAQSNPGMIEIFCEDEQKYYAWPPHVKVKQLKDADSGR